MAFRRKREEKSEGQSSPLECASRACEGFRTFSPPVYYEDPQDWSEKKQASGGNLASRVPHARARRAASGPPPAPRAPRGAGARALVLPRPGTPKMSKTGVILVIRQII